MASIEPEVRTSEIPTLSGSTGKVNTSPKKGVSQRTPSVQRSSVRPETERLLELEQQYKLKLENQVNLCFEELKSLKSLNSALELEIEQDKNATDQLSRHYEARLQIYKTTALEREETYQELTEENQANADEARQYEQLSEELQAKLDELSLQLEKLDGDLQLQAVEIAEKEAQNEQLLRMTNEQEQQCDEVQKRYENAEERCEELTAEKEKLILKQSEFELQHSSKLNGIKIQAAALAAVFALACICGAMTLF